VLDDDHRVAPVPQVAERLDQPVVVPRVQADGGLVEDVTDPRQVRAQLGGKPDALGLAPREGVAASVEGQVVEPHLLEKPEPGQQLGHDPVGHGRLLRLEGEGPDGLAGLAHRQGRQLRDAFPLDPHGQGLRPQTPAAAVRAGPAVDRPDPFAGRAGPVAAVEGEEPGVEGFEPPGTPPAGEPLAQDPGFPAPVRHPQAPLSQGQRAVDDLPKIPGGGLRPADHGVDVVLPEAVQRRQRIEGQDAAVDPGLAEAAFPEPREQIAMEALPAEDQRRRDGHGPPARPAPDLLEHRIGALRDDGLAAARAVLRAELAVEEPQEMVDLREGRHGRAPAPAARALLDGHRGRDAGHAVHLGAVHDLQVLADVVRQALEVAPLPLGEEDVEGERRFARAAHARDDDQPVPGDLDRQVLQVVLPSPPDLDGAPAPPCGRAVRLQRLGGDPVLCREVRPEVDARLRRGVLRDLLRRPLRHDPSPGLATLGPEIEDVVGALDHLGVVFDDDDAVARLDQVPEGRKQDRDVPGVQAHRGLVEDEERIAHFLESDVPRELDSLRLAPRKGVHGLAEAEIAEADVDERLEGFFDLPVSREERHGLRSRHPEDVADAAVAVQDLEDLRLEACAVALRARQVDVREELHFHLLEPLPLAGLAAAAGRVEGEGRRREPLLPCRRLGG